MEETVHIDPKEQTFEVIQTRVVTPEKEKRHQESPEGGPPTKIAKTEPKVEVISTGPVPFSLYVWFPTGKGFEHLDDRWYRSNWWNKHERKWHPRNPSVPIQWNRPENWKPETEEEYKERTKKWLVGGTRLEHEEVEVGGVYRFFEDPATKVRVTNVNRYGLFPRVTVQAPDGSGQQWEIFTDELGEMVLNPKRNRRNWRHCRKAKTRRDGSYILW